MLTNQGLPKTSVVGSPTKKVPDKTGQWVTRLTG